MQFNFSNIFYLYSCCAVLHFCTVSLKAQIELKISLKLSVTVIMEIVLTNPLSFISKRKYIVFH